MLSITKQEADFLRANIKDIHIAMTGRNKKSKRKNRYVEETPNVVQLLKKYYDCKSIIY